MPREKDARDAVLQEMGDDAGTQAAPPKRERAEHAAVDGDDKDHLPTLVGMCEPEDDALDEGTGGDASCEEGELALEIAAKDGLFADSSCESDEEIDSDLERRLRDELLYGVVVLGDAQ